MVDFDLAVIGAGSAGLSVTAVAAQLGLRVVLVERERMGGDCLNTGCVPSKALLAAAHAVQAGVRAARFGVRFAPPEVDWEAVQQHVAGVIAAIAPMDSVERFRRLGAEVILGQAAFVAPDAIAVDGRRMTAKRIVIAAGSRAMVPDLPGLADVPFLTNATIFQAGIFQAGIFQAGAKPDHLLILGGGPIGLEMAQAHAGLGVRVTIVEAHAIAGRDDPTLVAGLRQALLDDGIAIIEGVGVARVEPGPILVLADGRRIGGSHLLVAVGRRPNLEGLELEAGGVTATRLGIATDAGLRSVSNRLVFAMGDIADPVGIGPRAFTHVASYHAGIVVRRALFRLPAKLDYRALPRVTYTVPELAQTGMTEAEARAAGHAVSVLEWHLQDNDRAQTARETSGQVRLVVGARGQLLGVGILADHAGEMISLWTLAIAQKVKLSALAGLIVPYPTLSEAGKRAAGSAFTARLFSRFAQRIVGWLARLP